MQLVGTLEVFLLRHTKDMKATIDTDDLTRCIGARIRGQIAGGASHSFQRCV